MRPRPTLEHIWLGYLAAVLGVGLTTPAPLPTASLAAHVAVHVLMLVAVLSVRWRAVHRSHDAARPWRIVLGLCGLPIVFSAMGWLLPAVNPEPHEYLWLRFDRAVFGTDVARLADRWLAPWGVDVLQVVYAGFYFVPIVAVTSAARSGRAAFDRGAVLVVGAFLASYLGYLLVPTLSPNAVLAHAHDVTGLWFTGHLRPAIDAAEANPWDCFPSGHTMLTVTSLLVAWRWNRTCFWLLLPVALTLIASTMLLRYHWSCDVLAGAAVAWPCARLCDVLMDLDAWPSAVRAG
ncbi:MAG TPA: phosphatase PAP2 family protein [Planctomycetota bacterium]|nr:phosphatase PAP2 family protein [Planctomycetota bacterium]